MLSITFSSAHPFVAECPFHSVNGLQDYYYKVKFWMSKPVFSAADHSSMVCLVIIARFYSLTCLLLSETYFFRFSISSGVDPTNSTPAS